MKTNKEQTEKTNIVFYQHKHVNLDVREAPIYGNFLYSSIEEAMDEAVKYAETKDSRNIGRCEPEDKFSLPYVSYKSYFGGFNCRVHIVSREVFKK